MSKALVRRDNFVFTLFFGTALLFLTLAAAPRAKAGDAVALAPAAAIAPATAVPVTPLYTPPPGVEAMQPVPDNAPPTDVASVVAPTMNGDEVTSAASNDEAHCLATAIYFEARGESTKGQRAVAEVILARTRVPGRPTTVCGVVYEGSERRTGCQFSFTCDRIPDVVRTQALWTRAERVAAAVLLTRGQGKSVARGATFYHADYVKPSWASRMVKVAQIGSHIFYRPKHGRYS